MVTVKQTVNLKYAGSTRDVVLALAWRASDESGRRLWGFLAVAGLNLR